MTHRINFLENIEIQLQEISMFLDTYAKTFAVNFLNAQASITQKGEISVAGH